jgi:hypothetical protein
MGLDIRSIMTSQQLEERSQQLETRIASLETELAQMKQMLIESKPRKNPWWLEIAGSCENDPTFDKAVRLGQEYRKSINGETIRSKSKFAKMEGK